MVSDYGNDTGHEDTQGSPRTEMGAVEETPENNHEKENSYHSSFIQGN